MTNLVIYDNTGRVLTRIAGEDIEAPTGVPYLYVDVPEGHTVVSVDASKTPNVAVLNVDPRDGSREGRRPCRGR